MKRLALTAALVASIAACDGFVDPIVCTDQFVYGLSISVVDAATELPVTDSVFGTIVDGAYVEELMGGNGRLLGAGERPGTYDLSVGAEGYEEWVRNGVVVTADECHVTTVELTAELVPSTS